MQPGGDQSQQQPLLPDSAPRVSRNPGVGKDAAIADPRGVRATMIPPLARMAARCADAPRNARAATRAAVNHRLQRQHAPEFPRSAGVGGRCATLTFLLGDGRNDRPGCRPDLFAAALLCVALPIRQPAGRSTRRSGSFRAVWNRRLVGSGDDRDSAFVLRLARCTSAGSIQAADVHPGAVAGSGDWVRLEVVHGTTGGPGPRELVGGTLWIMANLAIRMTMPGAH